ncbi:hypothetical protein GJ496_010881 [Pomphorhynchus laevis]|nr:hypothetical protein GJ496_010881 [Pomphorhynchus laevis]
MLSRFPSYLVRICSGLLITQHEKFNNPSSDNYPKFFSHYNSMSKCLTEKLYSQLSDRVSKSGFTVDNCIQPGIDSPGSADKPEVGVISGDEDCFDTFRPLYDAVLKDFCNFHETTSHSNKPWIHKQFGNLPEAVQSVRIRLSRNISGYPFTSHISRAGRRALERTIIDALKKSSTDMTGQYQTIADALASDSPDTMNHLDTIGVSLHKCLRPIWTSCQVSRDWPDGRGIFVSNKKDNVVLTVNDRDHIRFTMFIENSQLGSNDLSLKINSLFDFVNKVERNITEINNNFGYAWDDHFGYLGVSLHNIGSAIKISIRLKVPELLNDSRMSSIIRSLPLMLIEKNVNDGTIIICNKNRLGFDESTIFDQVFSSVDILVKIDNRLMSRTPALSWTYKDAINYISLLTPSRNTLHKLEPSHNLERMAKILSTLNVKFNQNNRSRYIHITGTKGKGWTGAILESILRKQGYSTGFFRSIVLSRQPTNFNCFYEDELLILTDSPSDVK